MKYQVIDKTGKLVVEFFSIEEAEEFVIRNERYDCAIIAKRKSDHNSSHTEIV